MTETTINLDSLTPMALSRVYVALQKAAKDDPADCHPAKTIANHVWEAGVRNCGDKEFQNHIDEIRAHTVYL